MTTHHVIRKEHIEAAVEGYLKSLSILDEDDTVTEVNLSSPGEFIVTTVSEKDK